MNVVLPDLDCTVSISQGTLYKDIKIGQYLKEMLVYQYQLEYLCTSINNIILSSYNKQAAQLDIKEDKFWTGDEVLCWAKGAVPYSAFPTVSLTLPTNQGSVFTLVIAPQVCPFCVVSSGSW